METDKRERVDDDTKSKIRNLATKVIMREIDILQESYKVVAFDLETFIALEDPEGKKTIPQLQTAWNTYRQKRNYHLHSGNMVIKDLAQMIGGQIDPVGLNSQDAKTVSERIIEAVTELQTQTETAVKEQDIKKRLKLIKGRVDQ